MPELPDIEIYREAIAARVVGHRLTQLRIANPFVLRSTAPAPTSLAGQAVTGVRRLGKRLVLAFDGGPRAVIHLMIAGRLHWKAQKAVLPKRAGLLAFDFDTGSLTLTEAGTKRRAALHLVPDEASLAPFDRGGLDVLTADLPAFRAVMTRERHTLKRSLTDPTILSGIGNAYSDEILHAAGLSPFALTTSLPDDDWLKLYEAIRLILTSWTDRLRAEAAGGFPEKVTAFRPDMAVHGKYRQPCPVCGTPVMRIKYAENEANYCATCQTGGRVLADRGLSRLLKDDWPRSLAAWEERFGPAPGG